ncbi:MAG: DNA alkylation repair protein [candidate division Zixibacteria bacterium]|nr:DNA alkylation repair protein [candidate division Zixibacteria bacterium]
MKPTCNAILNELRRQIAENDKPENRSNYQRFHKEKLKDPEGLKTPILRKISNRCFKDVKPLTVSDVLKLCDGILATRDRYMRFFAFDWALKVKNGYVVKDINLFEVWLKKYVDNWGSCDHLCTGAIGCHVLQFPDDVRRTMKWTRSKNRWLRRASAVSLIVPVRQRELLNEVFATADILLMDDDDLVQKGYGWMLKEATHEFPDEVFAYVMKHKDRMPRTALRYAIEKLPADIRKKAMKKG